MLKGDRDRRTLTERKRATASHTPEPLSELKRTRSLNSASKRTCSPPDKTTGTIYRSGQRQGAGKGIASQSKDKSVASPVVVERSSARGAGSSHRYAGNGGVQEACRSSSSAQQAPNISPLTTQYSEMSISKSAMTSNDDADILFANEVTDDPGAADIPEVVKDDPGGVDPLPVELMDNIVGRLPMTQVLQLQPCLGKALRNAIHRPAFRRNRQVSEGEFSPTYFMTDAKGDLHWSGYDTKLRKWTRLSPLNFAPRILPSPDPDLFKDYLMAGDAGLLCLNVGKATGREKLVICNPLSRMAKVLPPLIHARHPVLMHLRVDQDSGHYEVVVAGSAVSGTEELSLKTEVFDSKTGKWECPEGSDLPCPQFGLNEYQNGAYFKSGLRELLMCVAIVDARGRGVLVYDVKEKRWTQGPHVKQLLIPLVRCDVPTIAHLATTQIVECGGSVYVFSEQECGREVYFVIHKLVPDATEGFTWDEVMKRKRTGGRGLLVYPEFTCVPVSEHELGIFNTVEHTLEIIDLASPTEVTPLQYVTSEVTSLQSNRFHPLNPPGFVVKPNFKSVVSPGVLTLYKPQSKIEPVPDQQAPQNQKMDPESDKSEPQIDEDLLFTDEHDAPNSTSVDIGNHASPTSEEEPEDAPVTINVSHDANLVSACAIPVSPCANLVSAAPNAAPNPVSAESNSVQIPDRRCSLVRANESDTQPPQSGSWELKHHVNGRFISAK